MKEYDSILKEKKVYQDPIVHHSKYTKYVMIYIFSLILILGISYVIYYQKILSPSNIFFYDTNTFFKEYQNIFSHALPKDVNDLKNLEGTILLNDSPYNYGFLKDEKTTKIELSNQENYFSYQKNNQAQYIQISPLSDKIIRLEDTTVESKQVFIQKIEDYLTNDKFIKKFYLEDKIPIVEINLVLSATDLNQILDKTIIKEDYEVIITMKNNALTNQHIHSKVIVNNKTKNIRTVYTYDNEKIEYTNNDGEQYKLILSNRNDDFNLKFFYQEELYSIFLGEKSEKTYQYTYQVIDKVYNITLVFTQEETGYQYELTSNIEKEGVQNKQSLKVILHEKDDIFPEESENQIIDYDNLEPSEKQNYQNFLNNFFLPFREFMNEYQDNINELND